MKIGKILLIILTIAIESSVKGMFANKYPIEQPSMYIRRYEAMEVEIFYLFRKKKEKIIVLCEDLDSLIKSFREQQNISNIFDEIKECYRKGGNNYKRYLEKIDAFLLLYNKSIKTINKICGVGSSEATTNRGKSNRAIEQDSAVGGREDTKQQYISKEIALYSLYFVEKCIIKDVHDSVIDEINKSYSDPDINIPAKQEVDKIYNIKEKELQLEYKKLFNQGCGCKGAGKNILLTHAFMSINEEPINKTDLDEENMSEIDPYQKLQEVLNVIFSRSMGVGTPTKMYQTPQCLFRDYNIECHIWIDIYTQLKCNLYKKPHDNKNIKDEIHVQKLHQTLSFFTKTDNRLKAKLLQALAEIKAHYLAMNWVSHQYFNIGCQII